VNDYGGCASVLITPNPHISYEYLGTPEKEGRERVTQLETRRLIIIKVLFYLVNFLIVAESKKKQQYTTERTPFYPIHHYYNILFGAMCDIPLLYL
jgi:hypothetical protein